jgi:thioredoxin reductase (NADPH)
MTEPEHVIVIGGGPAGFSAAIYLARAMLSPLLIEGPRPGGQLTLTTDVENYPGFSSKIDGTTLVGEMRDQAASFGTRFLRDSVTTIEKSGDTFVLQTGGKTPLETKSIIIATGADAIWLGLPSEERFKGKGISACATCDGFFFKGKRVGVVGGGDSAMEEALFLTRFAESVTIIHRSDTFRASKIMLERARSNPKITFITDAIVTEIVGDSVMTGIFLKKTSDAEARQEFLELSGLFVAIGHRPATVFVATAGVRLDERGYIYTSERVAFENLTALHENFSRLYRSATSVPGIFAAGDCVDHQYRQAATAAGMGVVAALDVQRYLESTNSSSPLHTLRIADAKGDVA